MAEKDPLGHNVGAMSAEDRERTAKALRALRSKSDSDRAEYEHHGLICPVCDTESMYYPTGEAKAGTGIPVVMHCRDGIELLKRHAATDALWRSNEHTAAAFGVVL